MKKEQAVIQDWDWKPDRTREVSSHQKAKGKYICFHDTLMFAGDHVIAFALGSREWKIPPAVPPPGTN